MSKLPKRSLFNSLGSLFNITFNGASEKDKDDYSDPATAPHLVYRGSQHGGICDYALTRAETMIGRSKKNHITIDDAEDDGMAQKGEKASSKKKSTISKTHAAILRVKDMTFLVDKGTKDKPTNGVKINGILVEVGGRKQLRNGDAIRFGPNFLMTFYETADKVKILEGLKVAIKFDSVNLLPVSDTAGMMSVGAGSVINPELATFSPAAQVVDEIELRADYEKLLCMYELLKVSPENTSLVQHLDKAFDMAFSLNSAFEIGVLYICGKQTDTMKTKHFRFKTKENVPQDTSELYNEEFFKSVMDGTDRKSQFTTWKEKGCLIGAPLHSDSVNGVFCIYSRFAVTPTKKELAVINAISTHVCYIMENASLLVEQGKVSTLKEQVSRFLPPAIVKCMTEKHQESLLKGAKRVTATMLFVDIRGFTSYSEKCSPEKLVEMLNEYFERLVQCVFKYNGVVDKFVGDCLMAVFGAVETVPNPEFRAICAAQDISKSIIGLNTFLEHRDSAPISVGIGVHTGDVLAGFFGSKKRLEYSVQGDNVCIASKACDAAKDNGICSTFDTLLAAFPSSVGINIDGSYIGGLNNFIEVGRHTFKGLKTPISFHAVPTHFSVSEENPDDPFDQTDVQAMSPSKMVEKVAIMDSRDDIDEANNYPYLVYQCSYGVYELYYIKEKVCNIGRELKNDVVLKASVQGVSRNHAVITRIVKDGRIKSVNITDKNSTSGTFINGVRLLPEQSLALRNGDRISFADVIYMDYYENRGCIPEIYLANSFEDVEASVDFNAAEENIAIHHELEREENTTFKAIADIIDIEELRQDYAKLLVVYQLAKLAGSKAPLQMHLKKGIEYIFKILPYIDIGAIILLDQQTGPCSKIVQFRSHYDGRRDLKLSPAIFKKVYETKRKLITTDTPQDVQSNDAPKSMHDAAKTMICVPLVSHQNVLGILYVASSRSINVVSKKELALVDAICNQIAIAVENARIKTESLESNKIRDNLSRYLSPALVQKISQNTDDIGKKGTKANATVMYVNIIDFSAFRGRNSDEEIENTLNAYFDIAVDAIFNHDGIVDKYIGNQLMAIFGTLDQHLLNPELRAVRSALEIKQAISKLNNERAMFKKDPISIKIGINTGPVVAGLIGSTLRMEYTVIGDAVNIAARTTSSAKSNQVLITQSTFSVVSEYVEKQPVGEKIFKGKSMPIVCYEVTAMKPEYTKGNIASDLSCLPQLPGKI